MGKYKRALHNFFKEKIMQVLHMHCYSMHLNSDQEEKYSLKEKQNQ